jgi:crossover junction endodeoxyribonuclease RuvC
MIYLGIDPGLSGALAVVSDAGRVEVWDMPTLTITVNGKAKRQLDLAALSKWFDLHPVDQVVIEDPHALPGQGATSMFNFGFTCGALHALVVSTETPMLPVRPAKWKAALGLTKDKDATRRWASRVYPTFAHLWTRAKDDGRAEAVLLAYYGMKVMA